MKKTFSIAALAIAAAAPSFAGNADLAPADPVVAAPAPYVAPGRDWTGGSVGAHLGYGSIDTSVNGVDGDGFLGGVHAGYDYDFGNFIVGGELEYDAADIDLNGVPGSVDSIARLKLRAGADLGNTFLYGTGGAAYAETEIAGTNVSDNGYFLGVGVEQMVRENISVGGEVLYHQFDDFDGSGDDIDATTVAARVSFKF
ncbi:outer membrane protein [Actibacterium lipolyticum]|uniref:Outer membrane protein beta-barrel domain-containing protein n=1 Tax=Actibacterium lipolyticum TaxID=1524263 RepID=A0A238KFR2_9RHOB|nr:outer membrane beta-barrel protein [Actibacterium lipolyticum]SMX41699.1 hypothetical protein COL8621_01808 [Actibacterium lipolyticum]